MLKAVFIHPTVASSHVKAVVSKLVASASLPPHDEYIYSFIIEYIGTLSGHNLVRVSAADSSTCTTVDFVDSSGIGACAPVGHTWTDGETYVTTVLAWSECLDGKGTNCEQVAQDYMGGYTGCASCGETAYIVSLGFRVRSCTTHAFEIIRYVYA